MTTIKANMSFCSGRSLAVELVKSYKPISDKHVQIDFSNVESFSQSFINELVFQLISNHDIAPSNIESKNIKSNHSQLLFDNTISLFKNIHTAV